jgi:hypothetical protein
VGLSVYRDRDRRGHYDASIDQHAAALSKSTCVSIMWPTWVRARDAFPGKPHNPVLEGPGTKWVFASYADELRTKHSLDRRKMLQSDWYRQRWPKPAELTGDQNVKGFFQRAIPCASLLYGLRCRRHSLGSMTDFPLPLKVAAFLAQTKSYDRLAVTPAFPSP